jgi:predicted nucleic acid-binding protein
MIVADASVILNAVVDDAPTRSAARARLLREDAVLVPHLVDVEVLSALRRMESGGLITSDRALDAAVDLVDLPLRRHPNWVLTGRAWAHRANLTMYDAVYVALAETHGCPLVTADSRIARAPNVACPIEVLAAA